MKVPAPPGPNDLERSSHNLWNTLSTLSSKSSLLITFALGSPESCAEIKSCFSSILVNSIVLFFLSR